MSDVSGAVPDLSFSMQRASDGAMVTGESYRGKVVLVYFGYTHCPDVCPTTLSDLADALSKLGPEAAKVRVLFVSVDPERDTLELLKGYARSFGPQVDGLRGTENEIADTARRYRVAYSVKKKPEYTVMHTSAVYVFDQNGKARLVTTDTRDPAGIAADLKEIVAGG
ncbi:protein SCO1/2 [Rhizomicrobium palustre]|uniref:Protein SCO1/2 n=1 Tax=Rhizomicrobium palustre TaxID=189966 RepID=A0A846N3P7_9PROT|nr:SCO family protein [Rhizomicrobium palustre]NIK89727.1 protein SCO1/2 [Rhizomicrobium palustre]